MTDRDFCEFCGASDEYRAGQGRCEKCQHLDDAYVLTGDGTDPPRFVSGETPISGGELPQRTVKPSAHEGTIPRERVREAVRAVNARNTSRDDYLPSDVLADPPRFVVRVGGAKWHGPEGWVEGTVEEFVTHLGIDHRHPPIWRRVLRSMIKAFALALAFMLFCLLVAWAAVAFGGTS